MRSLIIFPGTEDGFRTVRGKEKQIPLANMLPRCSPEPSIFFPPAFDLKKGKLKRQWKGSGFLETTRPILSHLEQPFPFPIAQAASFQEACCLSPTKAMEAFGGQTLASICHETCYLERRRKAFVQPASCRHGLNLTRLDVSYPSLAELSTDSFILW